MIDALERDRLASFLRERLGSGNVAITGVEPIGAGYSRLMFRVDTMVDGQPRSFVTRTDPPPERSVSRSDRQVEWSVLEAMTRAGTVAIPPAVCFDAEGKVFGQQMIVSDYVPSRTLLSVLRNLAPDDYPHYGMQLAELAASIHSFDPALLPGLQTPATWDAYIDERVDEWRQFEREYYDSDPFIRYLAAWLDKNRPPPAPLGLIHGDFHAANVLVRESGDLLAVDWEFSRIGDPRIDFGWFLVMARIMPPDLVTAQMEPVFRRYRERSGLSEDVVNPRTIAYFQVMAGAALFGSVMRQTSALARGEVSNVTLLYVGGVLCLGHELWFRVTQMLRSTVAGARAIA